MRDSVLSTGQSHAHSSIATPEGFSVGRSDEPTHVSQADPDTSVIEIRDADVDIQEIMLRIRKNRAIHKPLAPSAAVLGRARMAQRRKKILASLKELQARIRDYGVVESHKQGWLARVDLFVKRSIRKLVQRHILQQHRVHLKLHTVLGQLVQYLQDEDLSIRACIDQAEREFRDKTSKKTRSRQRDDSQ